MFDAKRLIGRKFADPVVQSDAKLWPFKVVSAGSDDKPKMVVNYMGEEKSFHPEEISSMVLSKMKETAEVGGGDVGRGCCWREEPPLNPRRQTLNPRRQTLGRIS